MKFLPLTSVAMRRCRGQVVCMTPKRDLKITTIGAGYVGLVTGVCFSDFGYDVTCVDKDSHKMALKLWFCTTPAKAAYILQQI